MKVERRNLHCTIRNFAKIFFLQITTTLQKYNLYNFFAKKSADKNLFQLFWQNTRLSTLIFS